jgi:hypothetical protein
MYKVIRTSTFVLRRMGCYVFVSPIGTLTWPHTRCVEVDRLAANYNLEIVADPEHYLTVDALLDMAEGSSPRQREILFHRAEEMLEDGC